ncbi:MAG: hypothetical protein IPJ52_05670 [Rhodocyclaceae bacterium]|nr:hypothetical protein [Rhodocyclaceae bacterium]
MKPLPPLARLPMLALGVIALVVGVLAGLARLAVVVPEPMAAQAGAHGALMIAAFLGTVISLERAVALAGAGRHAFHWPYLAPLCAGLGGVALLSGLPLAVAQALFILAGALLTAGSGLLLRQQAATHLAVLAVGAACWLAGNIAWAAIGVIPVAVPWWMAFLVLTIAGERLELTRFLPPSPPAHRAFLLIVGAQLVGLVVATGFDGAGLRLFSMGLLALALWLLVQDIARRNLRQRGLTRYIAICLLAGYGWLALAGLLGIAGGFAPGSPLRDAALHAVFLGFVFSMIFGHAPIIFPAVAKVRIPYHAVFYLPLALLHGSVLVRLVADVATQLAVARAAGIANALALLVFIVVMVASVVRGRRT